MSAKPKCTSCNDTGFYEANWRLHECDCGVHQKRQREQWIATATDGHVKSIRVIMSDMTDEERHDLMEKIFEGWCRLCGAVEPCRCAPGYDL